MRRLERLLDSYLAAPAADLASIEAEIWDLLGAEKAVLVLDMSGFSRITQEHGIVRFLAMVRMMQTATRPIIARYGGDLVKYEADNLFAVFDTPAAALAAAKAINVGLDTSNIVTDAARDIEVCIGIDAGKVLHIPGVELFGDAMNMASKLGEDLAGPGEILISDTAFRAIDPTPEAEQRTYTVSGLEIIVHAVRF